MRIYPCSIDRARRPKTGRPHRIVQLGYALKYTTRVSALVAREKDTFPGKIGVDAHYSAFRRERNPKQIGQKNSMCSFPVRLLARLFFSPPSFLFLEKEKRGCGRRIGAIGTRGGARFSVRKTGIPTQTR